MLGTAHGPSSIRYDLDKPTGQRLQRPRRALRTAELTTVVTRTCPRFCDRDFDQGVLGVANDLASSQFLVRAEGDNRTDEYLPELPRPDPNFIPHFRTRS